MKKRIVVCCDGTWNEPESVEDHHKVPTNVLKMVRAIAARDEVRDIDQVVFYNKGIGTGALGIADRLIGGGTGYGISDNIRDCYNFLSNNYADGDDIYLFGFSRGAYTVRSLGGMLATVGLLDKDDLGYVPEAYAWYHTDPDQRRDSQFHPLMEDLPRVMPRIKFVGVWDTVGALGVPTPILRGVEKLASRIWPSLHVGFHDCNLLPIVENAYQALALDERRRPFRAALWNRDTGQRNVQQMWFAGVHSNVGGGYRDAGLSDMTLTWMVNRAIECGLVVDDSYLTRRVHPSKFGKLENSYSGAYRLLQLFGIRPCTRPVGTCHEVGEMIHDSVVQRIHTDRAPPYRPRNLVGADGALRVVKDGKREFVEVNGVRVLIYREREHLRRLADDEQATLKFDDHSSASCQIIDYTAQHGARLRVQRGVRVGERLWMESVLVGVRESLVVWCRGDEIGVRFAA